MLQYDTYESPLGTLWLAGKEGVLTHLSFAPDCTQGAARANAGEFDPVKGWLDSYFLGQEPDIPVLMEPRGTPFQQLIWQMLLKIPFGETRTYGELAREAAVVLEKEKMSAQAVGQAVGHNPIAIIIPCHRCVGAGGKLTGYAYGIDKKQGLLQHEQNRRKEHALCRFQTP